MSILYTKKWGTVNRYLRLLIPALLIEIFLFNLSSVRTFYAGEGAELTDMISVSGEAVRNASMRGGESGIYTAAAESFSISIEPFSLIISTV